MRILWCNFLVLSLIGISAYGETITIYPDQTITFREYHPFFTDCYDLTSYQHIQVSLYLNGYVSSTTGLQDQINRNSSDNLQRSLEANIRTVNPSTGKIQIWHIQTQVSATKFANGQPVAPGATPGFTNCFAALTLNSDSIEDGVQFDLQKAFNQIPPIRYPSIKVIQGTTYSVVLNKPGYCESSINSFYSDRVRPEDVWDPIHDLRSKKSCQQVPVSISYPPAPSH